MKTSFLLEDSAKSYYWMGFLLADGYCYKDKRISLTINNLDESHLLKLKDFLEIVNDINTISTQKAVRLNISDSKTIKKITKKFSWKTRKTYNPPEINLFSSIGPFNSICWLIGFIDGDGCIQNQHKRTDTKISIHIHPSWMDVLQKIHDIIDDYFEYKTASPHILKSGFLRYDIANTRLVQSLKKFTIEHSLPTLERKWDKIDLNRVHRFDKAKALQEKILKLKSEGKTRQQIAEELKININTIGYYLYIRKSKHKCKLKLSAKKEII